MKVLLLSGAGSAHTQRWANALLARGLEVSVVTQHDYDPRDFDPGVRVRRLPFRGAPGYYLNARALRAILREEMPAILHAHFLSGYGTTARLSGFHPSIVSVWGSDIFEFPARNRLTRHLALRNLAFADRILSTSEVMKREIESYYRPETEIALTPFGVDVEAFAPAAAGREGETLELGILKNLHWYSGVDILLRAFAMARRRLIESGQGTLAGRLRLSVAGEGPKRGEYEALARELGLGACVAFKGALRFAEVPAFLSTLDAYCAPSLAESFGVAVLEASACGLPVLASRVGGLPEVVEEGRTGILVPPGDPEALSEALLALVSDPGLRARLGEAGRAFVVERYSWARCVDRMLAAYREILDSREP
jgi:glycosyltransferase involved in cell wall biosynthesis